VTTHCFTSATICYLPKARVLADSVHKHHPDWVFHLTLCEPLPDWFDLKVEPFDDVILLEDLQIPGLSGWVFCRSVVEVCTGVKGAVMSLLLQREDTEAVVYLDPDIAVFSPLAAVEDGMERGSILLTPHQLAPEFDPAAVIDNEVCSLAHGVFNLGFIAVRKDPEGVRFGEWWRERLLVHCFDDKARGLFTDQRWCDLIPAFFERYVIIRNPAYNVATWNLTNRSVETNFEGKVMVNDIPLAFYHFTGYDSGAGRVMLEKYADEGSTPFDLWDWYDGELLTRGHELLGSHPWRYETFDNGLKIESAMRHLYRERADLHSVFPDPFFVGEGEPSFLEWWCSEGS
jgi:hypothetical protein